MLRILAMQYYSWILTIYILWKFMKNCKSLIPMQWQLNLSYAFDPLLAVWKKEYVIYIYCV